MSPSNAIGTVSFAVYVEGSETCVVTPVTEVLGVKIPAPPAPAPLPRTGSAIPVQELLVAGLSLLTLGLFLSLVGRRGRTTAPPEG